MLNPLPALRTSYKPALEWGLPSSVLMSCFSMGATHTEGLICFWVVWASDLRRQTVFKLRNNHREYQCARWRNNHRQCQCAGWRLGVIERNQLLHRASKRTSLS